MRLMLRAFGQKVKVDVDKTVNFTNFKTYGWGGGPISRNPFITKIITEAVEGKLRARGLTKSDDNPDIKVTIMAATDRDLQAVGPTWK